MAVVKVESRDDQVTPEASPEFVETGYVQDLSKRALAYLAVGYPVGSALACMICRGRGWVPRESL